MRLTPARGKVFLKRIETPETLTGGHIVLTAQTREDLTSYQMEVLAVGYPEQCLAFPDCEREHIAAFHAPVGQFPDEPHYHPIGTKAGDWVLVVPRSLVETDQAGLYCCGQDDILAILKA